LDNTIAHLKGQQEVGSEDCLTMMRETLTPQKIADLMNIISKSGKGINDLGDYEGCRATEGFEYVMINFVIPEFNFIAMRIGTCSPKSCTTPENYSMITTGLQGAIGGFIPGLVLEVKIEIPSEVNSESISTGAWMMIAIIAFAVFLWISGIIVQYSSFGNKTSVQVGSEGARKIEDRKSKLALLLYSFNPINNLSKLVTVKEGGDQRLSVLNGVRVLSICWVIVGHGFLVGSLSPAVNIQTTELMFNTTLFGVVPGGYFAVDSFFFLSGFLTFYLLTMKMYPKNGKANWLLIYFHRYYRLIFPVVFVTGVATFLVQYLGNGPYYKNGFNLFTSKCSTYWWTNFLFINNLYPWKIGDECIPWVWYLANDFQFFLMSPPIIYAYCKNRKLGYILPLSFCIVSMLISGVITWIFGYSVVLTSATATQDGMSLLYSKPWGRMGAYFVGAMFGLSYFEHDKQQKHPEFKGTTFNNFYEKLRVSRVTSLAVATVGIGLTALFVFPLGTYYQQCKPTNDPNSANCWSNFVSVLYNTLSRPLFVFGLGLILIPTFVGRLRIIKNFLGAEIFSVLARLNYMVYMIHFLVMLWYISDLRQAIYVNWINQWFLSIGITVVSFALSVPFSLICEVPFMNIEKYVLFPAQVKNQPQNGVSASQQEQKLIGKGSKYYPMLQEDETGDSKLLSKDEEN